VVLGVETFKKIDVKGRDAWEHVVEELSTGLTQPHMHFAPVFRILTSLDQPPRNALICMIFIRTNILAGVCEDIGLSRRHGHFDAVSSRGSSSSSGQATRPQRSRCSSRYSWRRLCCP
jgi:hypothetical protein